MSTRRKKTQVARQVSYRVEGNFNEGQAERILTDARASGLVTEYDTGRGKICWWQGRPGPEMRALRRSFLALLKP